MESETRRDEIESIMRDIRHYEYELNEMKKSLKEKGKDVYLDIRNFLNKVLDDKYGCSSISTYDFSKSYNINCFKNRRDIIEVDLYNDYLFNFMLINELAELIGLYPKLIPEKDSIKLIFNYTIGEPIKQNRSERE